MDFILKRRKRDESENHILDKDYEKDFGFDLGSLLGDDMYCRIINKLDMACMEHSILELWKFNQQKIDNLTNEKIIKALNRTTIR